MRFVGIVARTATKKLRQVPPLLAAMLLETVRPPRFTRTAKMAEVEASYPTFCPDQSRHVQLPTSRSDVVSGSRSPRDRPHGSGGASSGAQAIGGPWTFTLPECPHLDEARS